MVTGRGYVPETGTGTYCLLRTRLRDTVPVLLCNLGSSHATRAQEGEQTSSQDKTRRGQSCTGAQQGELLPAGKPKHDSHYLAVNLCGTGEVFGANPRFSAELPRPGSVDGALREPRAPLSDS